MPRQPQLEPIASNLLLAVKPRTCRFAPVARGTLHVLCEEHLVNEIVVDDPFIPAELHPIGILAKPREKPEMFVGRRRRRVEGQPSTAGKIHFYPAMRVARADD